MDFSHDSTILGQLRKGQAEANQRLDAIRVELQRLNVHLEQVAAALASHRDPPARTYPALIYVSELASTLRPKALALSAQARNFSRSLRTRKMPTFPGQLPDDPVTRDRRGHDPVMQSQPSAQIFRS
jgi:hypothetical protein